MLLQAGRLAGLNLDGDDGTDGGATIWIRDGALDGSWGRGGVITWLSGAGEEVR